MAKGQRFTEAEKRAIVKEEGSLNDISKRHGIHFTTISKWRRKFKKPIAKQMTKKKVASPVVDVKLSEVKEFMDLKRELTYWQQKYLQLVRQADTI